MPELIETAEARTGQRHHRAQEAGSDLPDPQGAGEAQRPDVRRGDAGDPARRLRLPPQPRLPLPLLPRRHLRLAEPDPPLRPADRGHRLRADSPAQGERAVLRPACGSRRSTTRTRTCCREKVFFDDLTPLHPDERIVHGNDARRDRHAGGRPDRADRLRPARV